MVTTSSSYRANRRDLGRPAYDSNKRRRTHVSGALERLTLNSPVHTCNSDKDCSRMYYDPDVSGSGVNLILSKVPHFGADERDGGEVDGGPTPVLRVGRSRVTHDELDVGVAKHGSTKE